MSSKKGHGDWNRGLAWMDNLSTKEGSSKLGGSVGLALAGHTHSLGCFHIIAETRLNSGKPWVNSPAEKHLKRPVGESTELSASDAVLAVGLERLD